MQEFLSGGDVTLSFNYGDSKEPTIPDVGSVTYTLLNHSGVPITGLTNVPVTTTNTTFKSSVSIPAINNTIDTLKIFERRVLVIYYQKNSQHYTQYIQYRLVPYANYSVTPNDVRQFIGVNKNELEDEDIDIFNSFVRVQTVLGSTLLSNALSSGTTLELAANDAILMTAVIDIIPSLQNRVAQSEKNGIMGFSRIKITDYEALLNEARNRYVLATGLLLDVDTGLIDFTLIVTTQDTDVITGA